MRPLLLLQIVIKLYSIPLNLPDKPHAVVASSQV